MFCGNCGSQISDGMRFCPNCGAKVEAAPVPFVCSDTAGLNAWEALKNFIASKYRFTLVNDQCLNLIFDIGNGRSQNVYLEAKTGDDGAVLWLEISSPIGQRLENFYGACEYAGNYLVGGIVKEGDTFFLRSNSVMASINLEIVDFIMGLICNIADELEDNFVGGDAN